MSGTEAEFERCADAELHVLVEALIASGEEVDPDLESGVLSINFDDDSKFVVNSHRAARQIWMSALSRAWHFDFNAEQGQWQASSGDELWSTLNASLSEKLGRPVTLRRDGDG